MRDEDKSREDLLEELKALRLENRRLRGKTEPERPTRDPSGVILVVDDNDHTRELVAKMVAELGYRPITASTSQEALAACSRNPGDIVLIISDIVMPDKDGPHLLREVAKLSPGTKMIFMSGYAEDEIVHDAVYRIQDSNAAFLKKPFTLTELEPLIQEQLGRIKG